MSLLDRFLPKAPREPAGDYAKENAEVIQVWENTLGQIIELWESEAKEAGRVNTNHDRTAAAEEIAATARALRVRILDFYTRRKLRP